MRLFIALRLPEEVITHLDAQLRGIRDDYAHLRWIPPERWHLTLAFVGEVAEREVDALKSRITRRVATATPMQLRLGGGGRFGDRVLYVGVLGDADALRTLAERLAGDDRRYRPHLTVARSREHTDLRPVVERLSDYSGPAWSPSTIELIQSRLGPHPTYETLASWPVRRPGAVG